MEIFEYPLLRICGSSINSLDNFINTKFYEKIEKFLKLESELLEFSTQIMSEVELVFKGNLISKEKHSLVNVKKRIEKLLPVKQKDLINLNVFDALSRKILSYNTFIKDYREASVPLEIGFDDAEKNFTKEFKKIILNMPEFSSAILLSSFPLFNDLQKYLVNDKVERKTEISLFKYFVRYITKTSPYSEFTHTNFNLLSTNKSSKCLKVVNDKRNLVTLNLYLKTLLFFLIKRNRSLFSQLDVNLNKTIVDFDSKSSLYISNQNNVEQAHILNNSPIICEIFRIFSEKSSLNIETLLNILLENVDVEYNDLLSYIFDLVENDVITVVNFSFNEEDVWLELLIIELDRIFPLNDNIQNVIHELCNIDSYVKNYENETDPVERKKLLNQIIVAYCNGIAYIIKDDDVEILEFYRLFKDKFLYDKTIEVLISEELPSVFWYLLRRVKKSQFIYEDVKSTYEVSINKNEINNIVNSIDKLNRVSLEYANNFIDIPTSLWLAFINNNSEMNSKSFVQMYHDYWQLGGRDESLNEGIELSVNNCQIVDKLVHESLEKDEVNISSDDFEVRNDLEESSYSVFTQLFVEKNKLMAVLNSDIIEGFGRLFGRFFNRRTKQDEVVLEKIRSFNLSKDDSTLLVQLYHPSDFNANIHPTLLENKLAHLDEERIGVKNIYLKDLLVRYDKELKRLLLYNKVLKKNVKFIDVDLQAQESRPTYFRFLMHYFSMYKIEGVPFVVQRVYKIRNELNGQDNICVMPRITLDNNVILRRKSWKISHNFLKEIICKDFNCFFIKMIELSKIYSINNMVFAQILNDKNRKPFYVNFQIPITVRILYEFLKSNGEYDLFLSEMMPNPDSLFFNESGRRFVTEHIVDWRN